MTREHRFLHFLTLVCALGCAEDVQLIDDGGAADGRSDGPVGDVASDGPTTDSGLGDGAILDGASTDGSSTDGAVVRGPVMCQAQTYQCGNTLDDDGDGLTDDQDPDCLGPCDNNEAGLFLGIPGGDSAPCRLDCYFDGDQGSGNDGCNWDHRCDPLEPDLDPLCGYADPPPPAAICPAAQASECGEVCSPLVPNGCDCFGCCNLPARSDRWVFIGSLNAAGTPTCTLDQAEDDGACHPCTPVDACLNPCGECELCLGRTELPPECLPSTPDAGVPDAGVEDGGVPGPTCDDGRTQCGLPGLPECAPNEFCLTGCCTLFV